jgi:hypothetical protein
VRGQKIVVEIIYVPKNLNTLVINGDIKRIGHIHLEEKLSSMKFFWLVFNQFLIICPIGEQEREGGVIFKAHYAQA